MCGRYYRRSDKQRIAEAFRVGRHHTDRYELWDEHILPPGQQLRPVFDFANHFKSQGVTVWSSGWQSYELRVTASDLSKSVVLTYSNLPVLAVSNVKSGLPWRIRWRYAKRSLRWCYLSIRTKIVSKMVTPVKPEFKGD
jgi:hypothetical protein